MSEEEEKQNICACLFKTFIMQDDGCIFIPERDEHNEDLELEWSEDLDYLERLDDFEPCYIVLFNNEMMHYEGDEYYKVYKIIAGEECSYDMTVLESLGIIFYTNGISGKNGQYLVMADREIIITDTCPITFSRVRSHFYRESQEIYEKIVKILEDES